MADEKRLIDYEQAKRATYEEIFWTESEQAVVRNFLAKLPKVDAVEVVHGEWIVCGDGEYVPFMCSACGKTTSWYHKQTANYCPNCGAKMDGGNAQ